MNGLIPEGGEHPPIIIRVPSRTNADVAMEHAAAGLYVFPCKSSGDEQKEPETGVMWRDVSTTHPNAIRAFWHRFPDSAPGVDCAKNRFIVIDCDRKPGRPDGLAAFLELAQENGDDLARVPAVNTPSGGRHYYFRQSFSPPHGSSRGTLPPAIDVKGHGGYVLAPGAVIEAGAYVPENDLALRDAPEVPDWLAAYLRPAALAAASLIPSQGIKLSEGRFDDLGRREAYVAKVLDAECRTIETAAPNTRNNTIARSAFKVGQFVGPHLGQRQAIDALENACLALGLPANDKALGARGTVARALAAGMGSPRAIPDAPSYEPIDVSGMVEADDVIVDADTAPARPECFGISMAELKGKKFPPIVWIVPDILPEGCTLLAGKPKLGKSWIALDIGIAVATGGQVLGRDCDEGDVLYLALEDNERRLQGRGRILLPAQEWPGRLTLSTDWPRAKDGCAKIKRWAASVTHPRLVIVDVLNAFRAPDNGKQSAYQYDYAAVAELRDLANQLGISVLVVHHTRKGEAEDPIDMVSGTLGLTGAADSTLVLSRTAEKGTTLYGRGRDVAQIDFAIRWHADTCRFSMRGLTDEVARSDERTLILNAIKDRGEPLSPSEIAAETLRPSGNIRRLLGKMVRDGQLVKGKGAKYALPGMLDTDTGNTGATGNTAGDGDDDEPFCDEGAVHA